MLSFFTAIGRASYIYFSIIYLNPSGVKPVEILMSDGETAYYYPKEVADRMP